jgi:hypothetical protein
MAPAGRGGEEGHSREEATARDLAEDSADAQRQRDQESCVSTELFSDIRLFVLVARPDQPFDAAHNKQVRKRG